MAPISGNQWQWHCPLCGATNYDTRKSFVLCTSCGATYDELPEDKPPQPDTVEAGDWN